MPLISMCLELGGFHHSGHDSQRSCHQCGMWPKVIQPFCDFLYFFCNRLLYCHCEALVRMLAKYGRLGLITWLHEQHDDECVNTNSNWIRQCTLSWIKHLPLTSLIKRKLYKKYWNIKQLNMWIQKLRKHHTKNLLYIVHYTLVSIVFKLIQLMHNKKIFTSFQKTWFLEYNQTIKNYLSSYKFKMLVFISMYKYYNRTSYCKHTVI